MISNRVCHLCGRNGCTDPLDKHHVFGGAYRAKSEKYGLYVYLCHHEHHIFGSGAAHQNAEVAEELHKWGQSKVMREQGWTVERFILEFGCNYLDEDEIAELQREQQSCGKSSFKVLPDAMTDLPWGCMA